MTNPTQIPASVIPELVEYLMKKKGHYPNSVNDRWETVGSALGTAWEYGGAESVTIAQDTLTAALEAFNEREMSPVLAEHDAIMNVLDKIPTCFGAPEGNPDET